MYIGNSNKVEGGKVNGLKCQILQKKVQRRGGWEIYPMNRQWGDGIDKLPAFNISRL